MPTSTVDTPTATTQEPAWLAERRALGKLQFASLPTPTAANELWRFARVKTLQTDGFSKATTPPKEVLQSLQNRSNLITKTAGQLVFVDDAPAKFEGISNELSKQGVLYLPIADAINQHPKMMEKYFLKETTKLGSEKFFGLHAQQIRAGSVLYIPKGVVIQHPIVNYYWTSGERASVFPHTLVIAEDNANASVVDIFFSETAANSALCIAAANIHAGPGAHVFRKVVQDWNEKTISFQLDSTVAARDAMVKNIAVNIGAERAR